MIAVTATAARSFDVSSLDLDALNAEFAAHGDATLMIRWLVETIPVDRLIVASAMTSDTAATLIRIV